MLIRRNKATALAVMVSLALGLGGCIDSSGSGSGNGADNDQDGGVIDEDGLDLSDVSLAETDGLAPFRGVLIEGLPDDASAENLHVHYRLEGESASLRADSNEAVLAPVASFRGGPIEFLVPLVKADGTSIEMRITDGVNESSPITVTIEALPERQPGAWEDYVSGLQRLVQTTAEEYGFTYPNDIQTLVDNPYATEVPYVPLVLAHYALEGDGNEFALNNAEFEDADLELIERIIPHMTLIQDLARYTDFAMGDKALIQESLDQVGMQTLPTVGDLEAEAVDAQMNVQLQQQGVSPQSWNDVVTFESGSALIDGEGLFGVDGPADVQEWMSRYDTAWRAQRTADAAIRTADYALTAATLAAIVSSGGSATPGAVASRAASRAALKRLIYAAEATAGVSRLGLGFIPCCLHEITTEFNPESGVGDTEDGEGEIVRIDGVTAQMQNDGTDFGKELLERFVISELGDNISGAVATQASDALSGEVILDAGFREVFRQFDVDLFDVRFVWSNVDITGLNAQEKIEWEKYAAAGGDPTFKLLTPFTNLGQIPFQYDSDTFFGREGDPTEVEARPSEDFYTFGPWHPAIPEDRSEMRGVPIQVAFAPTGLQVDDPDEVIEFSVEVRNAEDTSLVRNGELQTTPDLGDPANQDRLGRIEGPLPSSDEAAGTYDYEYHAPSDLTDFETILVETESDSEKGVRGRTDNPDRRRGSMFIRTDAVEVAVSPQRVCLDEGETETFQATDALTGEELEVAWEAEHGSITPSGTFTSPGASVAIGLTSEVTASLVSDPEVTATAIVTMECSCWYDATVGGNIGQSYGADPMWIDFDESSKAIESIQLSAAFEDDAAAGVELVFDQPVPAGATGDFTARIPRGTFRTDLGFTSWDPSDLSTPGVWQNVPYGDDPWDFVGLLSLQDNSLHPLSDTDVPPITVTFNRHEMWDSAPDGSELRGGERSLSLTISGNVRRLGIEPISDDEAEVVIQESGELNVDLEGEFWPGAIDIGVPDDRQTCSPVL